jgi:hypothetical protein
VLDHRLGVPFGGAAVPVVQADLAAEVQHQRLERRRRVELEAHLVQLLLGRAPGRAEARRYSISTSECFCSSKNQIDMKAEKSLSSRLSRRNISVAGSAAHSVMHSS